MLVTSTIHASMCASMCALMLTAPAEAPTPPDRPAATGPVRTARAGGGLMAGGGALMVVGAAVLVPMGIVGAARARQPDPREYTAVEPFRQDMLAYRDTVQRSMTLGLAGSVTAVVGATAFVTGAITWGIARRRMRRSSPRLTVGPTRRGVMASFTGRF